MKHSTRKNLFMLFLGVPGAFIAIFGAFGAISQTIMLTLSGSSEPDFKLTDAPLPLVLGFLTFSVGLIMISFSVTLQASFEPWLAKPFSQIALDLAMKLLVLAASCAWFATVVLVCRDKWGAALISGTVAAVLVSGVLAMHRSLRAGAAMR